MLADSHSRPHSAANPPSHRPAAAAWQPPHRKPKPFDHPNPDWAQRPQRFSRPAEHKPQRFPAPASAPPPNGLHWRSRFPASTQQVDPVGGEGSSGSGGDPSHTILPFEQSGESVSHNPNRPRVEDSDSDEDDIVLSDTDYDSEADREVTPEVLKKSKRFRAFFEFLESQGTEQINEGSCRLHCPACKGGAGAIEWYRGVQSVLNHAKSVSSKRVRLHRKFAEVLERDLKQRGARLVVRMDEEPFVKWKSSQEVNDDDIVWPPMVIVQNTRLERDENGKWIGMRNEELQDLFKGYKVRNAKNAYGPGGHRGLALLRFDSSAMGFLEAERLHKHFINERRGRAEWESHRARMFSMGKRVLYGYLASKEDMDFFNRHSKGKQKQKFEIKSYHSMVVENLKKMGEDNDELLKLQQKDVESQEVKKTLQATCSIMERNLYKNELEIKKLRRRDMELHEDTKKRMDDLDQSYGRVVAELTEELEKKEKVLEKMQDLLNTKCLDRCVQLEDELDVLVRSSDLTEREYQDRLARIEEEVARQANEAEMNFKDLDEFECERKALLEKHRHKLQKVKLQNLEAKISLEKLMAKERNELQEKYMEMTRKAFRGSNST
ncbi:protein SUPPRESSOR OF GENE SILENCING 3 homolog isoform X2 [Nymphaea colorata]|nr:protein SUPPRESSOR OF GENE SILENCING 3 homolog isoform X2 [Nymphaea colorata]